MIIQIALGIVLAVLILMFWPVILGLAMIAVGIAIALAVLAVAVYFAVTAPAEFFSLLAMAAGVCLFCYWLAISEAEREAAKRDEAQLRDRADGEPTP